MPDDVCDGWKQCPEGDDDWLCDVGPCPDGCLCQGLAFLCQLSFNSGLFPALRYLDVQNAPLNPSQLPTEVRTYLVYLRVNNGTVAAMPDGEFPNLQTLDLGDNDIVLVNMT
jgi:hypothetical protein